MCLSGNTTSAPSVRAKDVSHNDPNKVFVKVCADMEGEIFDTQVDLLPLTIEPRERVEGDVLLFLDIDIISGGTQKSGVSNIRAGVVVSQAGLVIVDTWGLRK